MQYNTVDVEAQREIQHVVDVEAKRANTTRRGC